MPSNRPFSVQQADGDFATIHTRPSVEFMRLLERFANASNDESDAAVGALCDYVAALEGLKVVEDFERSVKLITRTKLAAREMERKAIGAAIEKLERWDVMDRDPGIILVGNGEFVAYSDVRALVE